MARSGLKLKSTISKTLLKRMKREVWIVGGADPFSQMLFDPIEGVSAVVVILIRASRDRLLCSRHRHTSSLTMTKVQYIIYIQIQIETQIYRE